MLDPIVHRPGSQFLALFLRYGGFDRLCEGHQEQDLRQTENAS